jgi:hypothetical protein
MTIDPRDALLRTQLDKVQANSGPADPRDAFLRTQEDKELKSSVPRMPLMLRPFPHIRM